MRTRRLQMILKHVDAKRIADIGTDHGYIPVELARRSVEYIIATDVRRGPLEAARRRIEHAGADKKIELRQGDGLSPLAEGECDNIIIAGMGGELICKILAEGENVARSADRLILQPMNSQDMLRSFLSENGYAIMFEDIACEDFKVYNIIVIKSGEGYRYKDEFDLHLPAYLHRNKRFPALAWKKQREFTKILTGLKNAAERDEEQIARYTQLLERTMGLIASLDCSQNEKQETKADGEKINEEEINEN